MTLGSIVDALGGALHGDRDTVVEGLASIARAGPRQLTFVSSARYLNDLAHSQAACVVVSPADAPLALQRGVCIVTEQPYLYFARLTQLWKQQAQGSAQPGVHPSAVVDASASIDPTASVGPLCVVERGASIGAHTVLKSRVTVSENCRIGARCLLHSGAVIGADGFGFAPNAGAWEKIEQLGAVVIGDDVEIGANTCIDRGALDDTVIEDGVKLDNLIQIGHNVHIGRHTAIAGCVGVAGSATIGAHCTIGGAVSVFGHLTIADHVVISATSVVTRSIHKAGHYTGRFPIDDNAQWEKNAAALKRLHSLRERVRALESSNKDKATP